MSWWDSISDVERFNNWTLAALAIFGGLTALALFGNFLASRRLGELRSAEAIAQQSEKEALERRLAVAESRLSQRELSDEQQRQIEHFLVGSAVPLSITVSALTGDQEAVQYARQFMAVLERAGWAVQGLRSFVSVGTVKTGVTIDVDGPRGHRSVDLLYRALVSAGIDVRVEHHGLPPSDRVGLVVGAKPIPGK